MQKTLNQIINEYYRKIIQLSSSINKNTNFNYLTNNGDFFFLNMLYKEFPNNHQIIPNDKQIKMINKLYYEKKDYIIKILDVLNDFFKDLDSKKEKYNNKNFNQFLNINSNFFINERSFIQKEFWYKKNKEINIFIFEIEKKLKNFISTVDEKIKFFEEIFDNEITTIIGKNGIGKTRWLNSLNVFSNVTRISSERNVFVSTVSNLKILININNFESSLRNCNPIYKDLIENLRDFKFGITKENKYELLIENFKFINKDYKLNKNPFDDREIIYYFKNKKLEINNLSFGEKHLLYFLIEILFAQKNSYVFIDEPEIGLNEEKLTTFFKNIFKIRDDLKFIFITHSEKFSIKIQSEFKSMLYWFKDAEIIENPDIEKTDKEIDIKFYFEILCNESFKKILLVEGKYDSIDRSFYEIFYKDWKIINSESKSEVKDNIKKLTTNKVFNNFEIIGLIDKDEISEKSEIEELAKNNIFIVKLKKIESIFYEQEFLNEYYKILINKEATNKTQKQIDKKIKDIQEMMLNDPKKLLNQNNKKINNILKFYEETIAVVISHIKKNKKLQKIIKEKLLPNNLK